MALGETSVTVIPGLALDDELARMLGPVERVRANRWLEGEITDASLGHVLAAVTNRAPLAYAGGLDLGDLAGRPNRWRESHVVSAEGSQRSQP